MTKITSRHIDRDVYQKAIDAKAPDVVAKIIAGRIDSKTLGQMSVQEIIDSQLKNIPNPSLLLNARKAAERISHAIRSGEKIGILTDYDVDGITAHTVIIRFLTEIAMVSQRQISSIIGQRLEDGYGISESLVDKLLKSPNRPSLIVTADCGSSDEARLKRLKDAGIDVIVTDHHIVPDDNFPESAYCLVNPTQQNCQYPDKLIAGCMVAWLLMCEVRATHDNSLPKLSYLLDFVALGTVADAVSLFSVTNRAVVKYGLTLINQLGRPCWYVFSQTKKNNSEITVSDLGYQIGPRINARSRLDDPYIALSYLMAGDGRSCQEFFDVLEKNNEERKVIESQMVGEARKISWLQKENHATVAYNPEFHPGVQGIVASRIVESTNKPAIILSPIKDDLENITGSCRTISGVDIRQALQFVADNTTDLIFSFGGHVGAAGCKIKLKKIEEFRSWIDKAIEDQLGKNPTFEKQTVTDGELSDRELSIVTCDLINSLAPYGRGFEEPIFHGYFKVTNIKMIGKPAIHMSLEFSGKYRAIWFKAIQNPDESHGIAIGDNVTCVYTPSINEYNGYKNLQLMIKKLAKSNIS